MMKNSGLAACFAETVVSGETPTEIMHVGGILTREVPVFQFDTFIRSYGRNCSDAERACAGGEGILARELSSTCGMYVRDSERRTVCERWGGVVESGSGWENNSSCVDISYDEEITERIRLPWWSRLGAREVGIVWGLLIGGLIVLLKTM